ncbi:Zn-ribbon domain-containing OB-fold protein [Rhodococcus koreensis]
MDVDGQKRFPAALPLGPQVPVDIPFWEGLRVGELRIQHCGSCGRWIWGPSWACPVCHRLDPEWEAVEQIGTIYSWTRTHHAFPASQEFTDALPYTTALIELPHAGGRRMLGIVTDADGDNVRIGQRVRGWIQPASEMTGGWPVLRWTTEGR